MSRRVPFNINFKTIDTFGLFGDILLYSAFFISAVIIFIDTTEIFTQKDLYLKWLNEINCIFSVGYFIINIIMNYLFQCAEECRRNDFFDNSLRTTLADQGSEEYFTNENLEPGIYKMGVNSFENAFFSKNIAKKMLTPTLIRLAIVTISFLGVAIFVGNKMLVMVLQLALPFTIIEQSIRLFYYINRVDRVVEYFKRIFAIPAGEKQNNLIIHNVANYEAIQSWATIKLDSKLFDDMNPQLSLEWEAMKSRINI